MQTHKLHITEHTQEIFDLLTGNEHLWSVAGCEEVGFHERRSGLEDHHRLVEHIDKHMHMRLCRKALLLVDFFGLRIRMCGLKGWVHVG